MYGCFNVHFLRYHSFRNERVVASFRMGVTHDLPKTPMKMESVYKHRKPQCQAKLAASGFVFATQDTESNAVASNGKLLTDSTENLIPSCP
jgi:hypothetical protein